ncbi:hypothetical protein HK104_005686 [Borealophlyctis nickersoniae]|nr:hypothetical protein HK104_005686 [Borealophlyctis nickersoniae]
MEYTSDGDESDDTRVLTQSKHREEPNEQSDEPGIIFDDDPELNAVLSGQPVPRRNDAELESTQEEEDGARLESVEADKRDGGNGGEAGTKDPAAGRKLVPHSIRSTTITSLMHQGVQMDLVMKVSGHRTMAGLAGYHQPNEAMNIAVAQKVNPFKAAHATPEPVGRGVTKIVKQRSRRMQYETAGGEVVLTQSEEESVLVKRRDSEMPAPVKRRPRASEMPVFGKASKGPRDDPEETETDDEDDIVVPKQKRQ